MRSTARLIAILIISISIFSCDMLKNDDDNDPNVIGGETNLPINEVGNTFGLSVYINGTHVELNEDIKVTKNDAGVTTISVSANPDNNSTLGTLVGMIPEEMRDSDGNVNAEVKFKVTSEGIQDYLNKDGKPYTIVKYDCKVGDKYQYTNSDGKTITRTVTAKSDQDDFQWGYYYIKTITIEQNSNKPGIKKYIYKANHKFGLVYFEVVMEDGSDASSLIFTQNY